MRVIIIGAGKTVYYLARRFIAKGYHVTIITRKTARAQQFSRRLSATIVQGNGSDPQFLEEAGARRASIVVALQSTDQDNLISCQLAKETFGVPRTVALIHDPENAEVFKKLGVTVAISVAQMLGQVIEEQVGYEEIINLAAIEQGRINITEVVLMKGAPAIGCALHELKLPENALIGAVIRQDDVTVPSGETRLLETDRLLLITQPHNHGATLRAIIGEGH